uniref:DUF6824 domain-containing protein n=1 Tax=Amphora coffeiformis TaxID=265554 RepID=A0A7S3P1B1_9STRA
MPSGVTDATLAPSQAPAIKEESATRGTPQQGNLSSGIMKKESGTEDDEGVEVVLGDESNPKMVEPPARPRQTPDQNVFRHPQAVRPRAVRAQGHPSHGAPPPPHPHYAASSGSWGYGHPPPPPHEYHQRPYPVPPYNPSGSFDEHGYHRAPHYSPHVSYPPYRAPEDVNVISPNHGDPRYRPPQHPRSRHMPPPNYYHYPPASPVSRPGAPPDQSPRMRDYGPRRDGPYSKAQRDYHDGYAPRPTSERSSHHPTVVAESSFDSEHHSRESMSHPTTPASSHQGMAHPPPPPPPPASHDPHYQFYGGGGSWGSFDSAVGPPPHFDDQRYYGFPPPDSPYGPYNSAYSPGGIYPAESFPPPPTAYPPHPSYAYSYDEDEHARMGHDYHGERREVTPSKKGRSTPKTSNKNNHNSHTLLPKAAEEIDFEVTDPPMNNVTPPSDQPIVESLAEVNTHDVLCGRGGGTNSQIGNRRFRKLVQEFQPTYLLARRKEKPLLARTIVLIIRKRGGRFLKKDEDSGELFEVGDAKAEAKTSQALREGLDVRATKSAASSLLEKKKKKQQQGKNSLADEDSSRSENGEHSPIKSEPGTPNHTNRAESPPPIPRLHGEEVKAGIVHPHSPDQESYRKRRRTRSVGQPNRFFPDFCPPRADLGYRPASPLGPEEDDMSIALSTTPIRRNNTRDEDERYADEARGCAGIAFDVVTGAATGSFCLGPTGWRR